uniref:7TM_GPCR_Srx domain-containing protein n=1 Tax=Heterorhabditis bacteriophora TaxID=37862 RepID=A0A1I7XJE4_HETBA
MDNFTLFDSHNDALLLFYNINGAICILLNLLAIYLIVFKSSRNMGEYRWHLLHYQNTMTGSILEYLHIIMGYWGVCGHFMNYIN